MPKHKKRKKTTYLHGVTASLDITNKKMVDSSFNVVGDMVDRASRVVSSALSSMFSFFNQPEPPLKLTAMAQLKQLAQAIYALMNEKKDINTEERQLKEKGEPLSPELEERRINILKELDELFVKQVNTVPRLIEEHARRRVDLFFLLAIAVYKQNVHITKGQTVLQHGDGTGEYNTAGCHASLFPNIVVEPLDASDAPSVASKLLSSITTSFEPLIRPKPENFLKGTQFIHSLNLTDELPDIVNKFDLYLEGMYGQPSPATLRSLEILNNVARGKCTPIKALDDFCEVLTAFYGGQKGYNKALLETPEYKKSAGILYPKAFEEVRRIQRNGVKDIIDFNSGKANRAYIFMQLRLDNFSIRELLNSALVSNSSIERRYFELQKEMLTPLPPPKPKSGKKRTNRTRP